MTKPIPDCVRVERDIGVKGNVKEGPLDKVDKGTAHENVKPHGVVYRPKQTARVPDLNNSVTHISDTLVASTTKWADLSNEENFAVGGEVSSSLALLINDGNVRVFDSSDVQLDNVNRDNVVGLNPVSGAVDAPILDSNTIVSQLVDVVIQKGDAFTIVLSKSQQKRLKKKAKLPQHASQEIPYSLRGRHSDQIS
ncbi:unnamed protein product [Ilex paraguariensis]|uniref:Uncharacterized protein n=1 Tax=Ilex paraguariensis TaxID=185542 RepID=A0ABC8SA46_9AQUA